MNPKITVHAPQELQEPIGKYLRWPWKREQIIHSARTAVAIVISLEIPRLFHLPNAQWAVISAMIVMQSTLAPSLTISKQQLAGTALGCTAGALVAAYFPPSAVLFSDVVLLLGLFGAAVSLGRTGYRFAGITLTIVVLAERTGPAWMTAIYRFVETSVGIAVALLLTALWPAAT
jgi:uncharacterized membrane protein YccC